MSFRIPRYAPIVVLHLLVALALVFSFTRCVLPADTEAASAASDRYVGTVDEAMKKYQAGELDLEAMKAIVAQARADLRRDLEEIKADIVERTKGLGAVGGAVDPLALGLTGLSSILASIFGTNWMRNKSRAAELAKVHTSIAETDKWVEEIEAQARPAKA